jgi:threonine dehydrogenase-like Zn-dependent dehydrogenase
VSPALEFYRSPARYLAVRGATGTRLGSRLAGPLASNVAPIRLVTRTTVSPPRPDWVRLRPLLSGICGSDLALLTGRSSSYLSPVVSLPFVPGHEVVAETLDDSPGLSAGSRVVVDPVLSCSTRALPACANCRSQRHSRCDHVTSGSLAPGLQTGFCADTDGGWSRAMTAHASQLHAVPDTLDDQRAVLIEPLACAIHSARRIDIPAGAAVLLVGAGTVGLLTLLALRTFTGAGPVYVVAKHGHQRERAQELGATEVFPPKRLARALRLATGGSLERPDFGTEYLLGGVDVAFECTGSVPGLDTAMRMVRAGGTVLLSGMPSGSVDLTPVWFRELHLVGSYASDGGGGAQPAPGGAVPTNGRASDFADAISAAGRAPLSGYVDAVYVLSRWREAVGHAVAAGRLGTVKVAFDPTRD